MQDIKREAAHLCSEISAGTKKMEDARPAAKGLSDTDYAKHMTANNFDFEEAHEKEDSLYKKFITAIAEEQLSPAEAKEAAVELKKVIELQYTRSYA